MQDPIKDMSAPDACGVEGRVCHLLKPACSSFDGAKQGCFRQERPTDVAPAEEKSMQSARAAAGGRVPPGSAPAGAPAPSCAHTEPAMQGACTQCSGLKRGPLGDCCPSSRARSGSQPGTR